MKKLKSLFFILLCMCLLGNFANMCVYAIEKPNIYVEAITQDEKDNYIVTVSIKNNTGIMGYKLHGQYDDEKVEIVSVACGNAFSKGIFQDNIGINIGEFDILWTGTEDVKTDEILFVLKIKSIGGLSKDSLIKMNYSKEDTFNEKWEDVLLDCEDIVISNNTNEQQEKDNSNESVVFENKVIVEFVDNAICDIDNNELINIINNSLEEVQISSVEDLSENKNTVAVDNILNELRKRDIDISLIDEATNTEKVEAIKKMYSTAKENTLVKEEIDVSQILEHNGGKITIWKYLIPIIIFVIIIVFIFIHKKGKRYEQ